MKFTLPCFFILSLTLPLSTMAHGGFYLSTSAIKTNQQVKQQLRVNSSQEAAQMARSQFGGKVLKVQKHKSGYRVKLIKADGHIVSIAIDAKTGRISGGN
jgi:uncharacterized membrane protein YkoI